jgi:hypothetical protein
MIRSLPRPRRTCTYRRTTCTCMHDLKYHLLNDHMQNLRSEDPCLKSGFHSCQFLQRHGATPTGRWLQAPVLTCSSDLQPSLLARLQYLCHHLLPPPHQRRLMRGTELCATTHLHLPPSTSLRRLHQQRLTRELEQITRARTWTAQDGRH